MGAVQASPVGMGWCAHPPCRSLAQKAFSGMCHPRFWSSWWAWTRCMHSQSGAEMGGSSPLPAVLMWISHPPPVRGRATAESPTSSRVSTSWLMAVCSIWVRDRVCWFAMGSFHYWLFAAAAGVAPAPPPFFGGPSWAADPGCGVRFGSGGERGGGLGPGVDLLALHCQHLGRAQVQPELFICPLVDLLGYVGVMGGQDLLVVDDHRSELVDGDVGGLGDAGGQGVVDLGVAHGCCLSGFCVCWAGVSRLLLGGSRGNPLSLNVPHNQSGASGAPWPTGRRFPSVCWAWKPGPSGPGGNAFLLICGVGVAVGSLEQTDVPVVDALDNAVGGGDVEVACGAYRDPPGVRARFLPLGDHGPNQVSGGQGEEVFGAGQPQPREPMLIGSGTGVGAAPRTAGHQDLFDGFGDGFDLAHHQSVQGVGLGQPVTGTVPLGTPTTAHVRGQTPVQGPATGRGRCAVDPVGAVAGQDPGQGFGVGDEPLNGG